MNFPKINGKQYATLSNATVTLQDMAEQTISTQIKIDGDITPYFSYDWALEYKGNKYIFPFRVPPGSIDESTTEATIDLTFQHWAIYELKRQFFFSVPNMEADAVVPDKYVAPVSLNLSDFVKLYAMVLKYYYGDKITIDLCRGFEADATPVVVEISYSTLWDVLIKTYELYGVRWQIEPNGDIDHYVIKVGYPATEVGHIFQYGFDGGLMKFERQAQDDTVKNMIHGRGGDKNLPYRYFKKHDEDNETFSADPDWIPELKDVPFSELLGATYRSYIQGWKAKHIDEYRSEYPDEEWEVTTPTAEQAYAPWAWQKGYTDSKFDSVEYVKDDESIQRYGELPGALDNNEEIFPTIQGIEADGLGRIDETVSIEEIESDEIEKDDTDHNSVVITPPVCRGTVYSIPAYGRKEITIRRVGPIYINSGEYGNLFVSVSVLSAKKANGQSVVAANAAEITPESQEVTVVNSKTGAQQSASGIPEGVWYYDVTVEVHNLTADILNVEVGDMSPKLITSKLHANTANTWHIWVKNLWGTTKSADESDVQYAKRVWEPILGDHTGEEAKVIFTDGMLALSEDYEFTIVSIPEYDPSQTLPVKNLQGDIIDSYPSHWKLTLAKCDADLDTTGAYLPSTKRFAKAGDHFAFIGIDMPHLYVVEAEKRLDDWKKDNLDKYKDIKPTIVVSLDKVRIHNYGKPDALVEYMQPGNSVRVADKRFILNINGTPASYETLFIQSVTYTYNESTETEANLLPDVEVTLSDQYGTTANPIAMLSSEIDELHRQVGSISNVAQIVQRVGDKRYLRKDISDRASASIDFMQGLDSYGKNILREGAQFGATFADGIGGVGGKIDNYGDAWLGGLRLRDFLEVPELRYNRTEITVGNAWRAPGGGIVESVTPDYNEDGSIGVTGIIKLHLEGGEIGAIAVGDLCMGIFHNETLLSANTEQDNDDGRGNFTFAGFCTVYFKVTEILDTGNRSAFRYELRPTSTRWSWQNHPSAQMSFVAYGSVSDENRKTSRYSTRTYERYLVNVEDWEFGAENIAAQFGDLTNLSIFGLQMSGYSAYLNNIYMSGRIEQIDLSLRMEIDYGNDNYIVYGGSKQITCRAFRGWDDVTTDVTRWGVSRDSGDPSSDVEWNRRHLPTFTNGSITIYYGDEANDLGSTPENGVKFTFTATIGAESTSQSVTLRRSPKDGVDGTDGVDGADGANGAKGEQGIQGCVYRMTQWRSDIEYRNDSALTDAGDIRYIDVVLIPNPLLTTKAYAFVCRKTHTSSGNNAPSISSDNEWWLRLNDMAPIYTPLLLADNAVITLLQSNQLLVMKNDGTTVNVGLGGGEYPLWIGAAEAAEAKFRVDSTGRAFMTGAEISGRITAGDSDGQRVDLLPEDKSLKIYNSSGSEVSSFEGNSYSTPTDMFGSASGNIPLKQRTSNSYGYNSGIGLGCGIVHLYGDDAGLLQRKEDIIISEAIHTNAPVELVVSGALATTYTPKTNTSTGESGVIFIPNFSSATISLHLDTYFDVGLTNRIGSQEIKRYSNQNGTAVISQKRIKTTTAGYHVLRITMDMQVQGDENIFASVKWGSAITGQSDIYGVYTSDFYVSRYFANGLCLGTSETNYVMAYDQGSGLGMRFKVENSGYGFDVSNSGIKYRHHSGDWVNMPMFVMKARYGYSDNVYKRYDGGKSFNGDLPNATRNSQGSIRLTYPASWASQLTLSEENLIVNVVGYGTVAEGGTSSVKASVLNITSTYMTIALADDNTPNDGGFLINVFYME